MLEDSDFGFCCHRVCHNYYSDVISHEMVYHYVFLHLNLFHYSYDTATELEFIILFPFVVDIDGMLSVSNILFW